MSQTNTISSAPYINLTASLIKPTETTKTIRAGLLLSSFESFGQLGMPPTPPYGRKQNALLEIWESLQPSLCTEVLRLRRRRGGSSVESKGTPLEKAIAAAFNYFPFGFTEPAYSHGWAWGPTFIAKVPLDYDEETVLALVGDSTAYQEYEAYGEKVKRLMEEARTLVSEVTIEKDKHADKCSGRRVVVGQPLPGHLQPAAAGAEASDDNAPVVQHFELSFPHVRLLRTLKYDRLTTNGQSYYIAAWKDNELVGYVVGRHPCEEQVAAPVSNKRERLN